MFVYLRDGYRWVNGGEGQSLEWLMAIVDLLLLSTCVKSNKYPFRHYAFVLKVSFLKSDCEEKEQGVMDTDEGWQRMAANACDA